MGIELNTQRYEDLTAAEQVGMEEFFRLTSSGEQNEAIRANTLALDLEHLISTIPLVPRSEVDPKLIEEVTHIRDQLLALTGRKVLLHVLGERTAENGKENPGKTGRK